MRRAARGFTLIEVLVAALVTSFVISLVMGIFISQQRAFTALDFQRLGQEQERDALLELESSLRNLGWGVDPTYAIDVDQYACAAAGTACRDSAAGPDQLVFISRNPRYFYDASGAAPVYRGNVWPLTAASQTSFTYKSNGTEIFPKGQLVLAMCPGSNQYYMATVSANTGPGVANSGQALPLASGADAYHGLNAAPPACTATGLLFKIDRYRYAIHTPPGTSVPYLVLDNGLDPEGNGIGNAANFIPIAKGIENLQVAYLLNADSTAANAAPDLGQDWVVGDTPNTAENLVPGAAKPIWPTPSGNSTNAFTLHPANVRGVRLTVTSRSVSPDPTRGSFFRGDAIPALENFPGSALVGGIPADYTSSSPAMLLGRYRRYTASTTVMLHNMATGSAFIF